VVNDPAGPLTLVVTRRCNLECVYCPVGKRAQDLDPARARDAVRRHLDSGGTAIRVTGGEPTLAWATVEAVLDEADSEIHAGGRATVEICTNAVELDEARIDTLDRPWIRTVVSVDGRPDAQRASGRAWPDALPRLLEIRSTALTVTVAPDRARDLLDNVLYLWGLGARRFNILPAYWTSWSAAQVRELGENLSGVAQWLRPHLRDGQAELLNLTRHGSVPLFNDHVTLDTDGRYHRGNLVLADGLFEDLVPDLRQRDGNLPPRPANLRDRAEAAMPAAVVRSNRRVDRALDRFVREVRRPPRAPAARAASGPRPQRLELHVAYDCDNHCGFCSEAHRLARWQDHPVSAIEIRRTLLSHARAGGSHVNLTGGEPSGHPAFLYALRLARDLGLRTYVGTNGSCLSDGVFAREALPSLDELSLSIHGSTAAIHDRATARSGSFEQLMAAREHARAHDHVSLFMNTVVTRDNFEDLDPIVQLCGDLGIRSLLLSNVAPEGRALDRYADLAVPLASWVDRAAPIASAARRARIRLRFFGLPLCALGTARMKSNDLHYDPRATVERARGPHGSVRLSHVVTRRPRRGRQFTRRCRGCAYRALCGGVFVEYVRHFGDDELEAIRG
jgi:MoaA/NifB/PqqE/SkfB family radical SAM enzyme